MATYWEDVLTLSHERIQSELREIKYIKENAGEITTDVPYAVLEKVLDRMRSMDFRVSIMSDGDIYDLAIVGVGKWRTKNKNEHLIYRSVGVTKCKTLYECMSKSILCLYRFIVGNRELIKK